MAVFCSVSKNGVGVLEEAHVVGIVRRLVDENARAAQLLQNLVHLPSTRLLLLDFVEPFACIFKAALLELHQILQQPLFELKRKQIATLEQSAKL